MTSPGQNDTPDRVRNAEETLRLLATRPAPKAWSTACRRGWPSPLPLPF